MDVLIGSNTLRNTNGVFTTNDQDFIRIELEENAPRLTMELFNPTGTSVAKLDQNQWQTNTQDRFEVDSEGQTITIRDSILKSIILQVTLGEKDCVSIPAGKFYLPSGSVSEITKESWRVGNKMELQGIDMDLSGGAIEVP
ncbi:MAG: hypothetical protein GKS05_07570 [Nitrospirales bacterium]|nr:hypothetical protein [Nitrospirales bacterium]